MTLTLPICLKGREYEGEPWSFGTAEESIETSTFNKLKQHSFAERERARMFAHCFHLLTLDDDKNSFCSFLQLLERSLFVHFADC